MCFFTVCLCGAHIGGLGIHDLKDFLAAFLEARGRAHLY